MGNISWRSQGSPKDTDSSLREDVYEEETGKQAATHRKLHPHNILADRRVRKTLLIFINMQFLFKSFRSRGNVMLSMWETKQLRSNTIFLFLNKMTTKLTYKTGNFEMILKMTDFVCPSISNSYNTETRLLSRAYIAFID